MSIQPAVQYDPKNDKIIGLEDWGTKRTRKIADHAIVFYIRCLASGKHMPIGYGYSHSATNSIQLARCIKKWLLALIKCGFKPVASVCDQGGTNIAAINLLIQQTRPALHGNEPQGHIKDNTIFLKNHKIIPLFDYVHLQKGVRNNLLTKHLMLNKNVSTDLKCPYAT
ncbi:uncharacterized protein LOC112459918 [Temnothorax curvispinosus]|uniref:Uncharacterized protein LOC112459918 n=1 Tax=Temnothorax curvispinosus TaxID=300111 RepID=A0A6J1QCN9_9HYME|nr:uncharacterized protein LOC112459918 [Temnothorax curvispinosus]